MLPFLENVGSVGMEVHMRAFILPGRPDRHESLGVSGLHYLEVHRAIAHPIQRLATYAVPVPGGSAKVWLSTRGDASSPVVVAAVVFALSLL